MFTFFSDSNVTHSSSFVMLRNRDPTFPLFCSIFCQPLFSFQCVWACAYLCDCMSGWKFRHQQAVLSNLAILSINAIAIALKLRLFSTCLESFQFGVGRHWYPFLFLYARIQIFFNKQSQDIVDPAGMAVLRHCQVCIKYALINSLKCMHLYWIFFNFY